MHILIYGGGAVGLGIASCLIHAGHDVDIVARPETVTALRAAGLVRTGLFGSVRAGPHAFASHACLDEIGDGRYDFVLICTKSFDSEAAAKDLAEHANVIGPDATLVLFQNGWGNAEIVCTHFDKDRVYNARVITGFHRHRANEVDVTVHADAIHVGSLFSPEVSPIDPLCRAIRAGGIPCETTEAIEKDLWAKMLYNCALNPLGAILGVPYGSLADHAATRLLMDRIVQEVFEVMTVAGYRTHWRRAQEFLDLFYARLVPDTAEHHSSMLQDIQAGKRTEIDALNGAVLHLAATHGVTVPFNNTVCNLIRFVESGRA